MSYYISTKINNAFEFFGEYGCSEIIKEDKDREYLKSYEMLNELQTGFKVIPKYNWSEIQIQTPKGFLITISFHNYFDLLKNVDITNNNILTPLCYKINRHKDVNTPIELIWENEEYIELKKESLELEQNQFKIIDLNKVKPSILKGKNDRDVYLGRYLNVNTNKTEYVFSRFYNIEQINSKEHTPYVFVQKTKSKKYDIVERELTGEELEYFKKECIYSNPDYYKIESIKKTPCSLEEVKEFKYKSKVYYGVEDSLTGMFGGKQYIINHWHYYGIEYKLKLLMDHNDLEYINPNTSNRNSLDVSFGYKFDKVFKIEYILTSGYIMK